MTNFHIEASTAHPEINKYTVVHEEVWPEFALNDSVANRYWGYVHERFPDFQFYVADEAGNIAAEGNSLPVAWDGDPDSLPDGGFGAILEKGMQDYEQSIAPTASCALSMSIGHAYQGQGISRLGVETMRSIAQKHGLNALLAPVRPSLKDRYPLIPIADYIQWTRDDGAPFDPWIRVHWRLGAKVVKVASRSMEVIGTVAQWEAWAKMAFPQTGTYTVPGALVPVEIDREQDRGVYIEPNVWMLHTL